MYSMTRRGELDLHDLAGLGIQDVYVTRKNKWFTMEGQPTGSGASYAGPGAQSFWTHRDDAMYREGSELPDVKCRQDQIG